jgi:hypothetical protein
MRPMLATEVISYTPLKDFIEINPDVRMRNVSQSGWRKPGFEMKYMRLQLRTWFKSACQT